MTVYERYTSRANILIQDGLTYAKMGYKGNSISDRMSKKTGLQFIARLLAIRQIIQKHGKEEKLTDDLEDELRIEEDKLAQQIENSKEFKKTFEKATAYDLSCLLGNSKEDEKKPGRTVWEKINFEEFEKRYEKFPQTLEKRIKDDEELAAKEAKEQAEKEAENRRREEELAAKEAKRAKEEEENRQREEERKRITADAENPDRVRRNMEFLDALGKHGPETKPEKLEKYITYMQEHPSVRLEAQKVVHEKGLNIKVPELDLDLMDEKMKGSLFSQIDQLRKGLETWELDKMLHDLDVAGKKADEEIAKDKEQKEKQKAEEEKRKAEEEKRKAEEEKRKAEEKKQQQEKEKQRAKEEQFRVNSRLISEERSEGWGVVGYDTLRTAINMKYGDPVLKYAPDMIDVESGFVNVTGPRDEKYFKKQFKQKLIDEMAEYNCRNDPYYNAMTEQQRADTIAEEKENLSKSRPLKNLFNDLSADKLLNLVGKRQKDGKWLPRKMDEVMTQLDREYAAASQRRDAIKAPAKELAEQLRQTTSKSFTGALKSFFVGNSKEYETALKAMDGLADGTIEPEVAKQAIKGYLDIRRNKVRNQEYGRERFDCFMKGLNLVMGPEEFRAYCAGVDEDRLNRSRGNYKGHTYPEDYQPDRSAQQIVNDAAAKAQDIDYSPTQLETAMLITGMRLGMDDHNEPLSSKTVRESAMNVMKDKRFQDFWKKHGEEGIKDMMKTNEGIERLQNFQNPEKNVVKDANQTGKKNVPQQAAVV